MSQSSATVPANATTPAVQAVPQVDPNAGTTSTTVSALGPNDIIVTLQYINDNSWPKDFKLDIELGNWDGALKLPFLPTDRGSLNISMELSANPMPRPTPKPTNFGLKTIDRFADSSSLMFPDPTTEPLGIFPRHT